MMSDGHTRSQKKNDGYILQKLMFISVIFSSYKKPKGPCDAKGMCKTSRECKYKMQ